MPIRSKYFVIAALAVLALFTVAACTASDGPSPFSTTTPVPVEDASAPGGNEPVDSGPDPASGERQFAGLGCAACHSTGTDKIVGPGLSGVGAKGDDYIRQSIVDPSAVIVDGFNDLMPKSFTGLKDSDIADLVAYLKSLG